MLKLLRTHGVLRYSVRHTSTFTQPINEAGPEYIQVEPDLNDEIVIAMSSGVDSSVAAGIYASKYPNVRGIYMANWSQTAKCTEADWNDVQKVCKQLKIPCERVNFEREYWNDVFQPMIRSYEDGKTPNPDTGCNKYVKFGKMIDHLTTSLPDKKWWLVTGHYSRVMKHRSKNEFHLLRGFSQMKDQSYYLSSIPKAVLSRILMPIGHYLKSSTRDLAKTYNLHIASKPDSQGLCFVSQEHTKFRDFLNEYIPPNPGNIVTEDGKVWGRHQGIWHATIGQKSAISMPQGDPKYQGVWFVSEKRPETNELVIVQHRDNPKLYHHKLKVDNWQWLQKPSNFDNIQLQYKSLQEPVDVTNIEESSSSLNITMSKKSRAMAPGQNVVLYSGNQVLGSGVIAHAYN